MMLPGDWIASNVEDIRDDDALEVYGHEDTSTVQLTSYSFEVSQLLANYLTGMFGDTKSEFLKTHHHQHTISLTCVAGFI